MRGILKSPPDIPSDMSPPGLSSYVFGGNGLIFDPVHDSKDLQGNSSDMSLVDIDSYTCNGHTESSSINNRASNNVQAGGS